jgi:enoyl-CoA hydratase/carnithine racemase
MPGTVHLDVTAAVATITLDNPGRLNAIDDALAAALAAAVERIGRRDDVGALVLRGAGERAFCAGLDLKYVAQSADRAAAFAAVDVHIAAFSRAMAELAFPSIALLRGSCYGGGVHLAVSTDFRIGASDVQLAIPAVKSRLFYPIPALERLYALIGSTRTRRMVLEGAPLDGETLLAWGFLDQVAPPASVDAAALTFATRRAAQPRDVVARYLAIFRALDRGDAAAARAQRADAQAAEGSP